MKYSENVRDRRLHVNNTLYKNILKSISKSIKNIIAESINLDKNEYLYHATPSCYVNSIKKYGLGGKMPKTRFWDYEGTPYENITQGCFLATDEYVAESYVENSEEFEELADRYEERYDKELEIVVFKVNINDLDSDLLSIDTNQLVDDETDPTYFYEGVIPYNKLTRVRLYESFDNSVNNALNEFNIFGVEVNSMQQGKMSDIDDTDKPVKWNDKNIVKTVQDIYSKMKTNYKFKDFLNTNNACEEIEWSYKIDTACTDGHTGRIIMNPEYMTTIYDKAGELGVQFIVLHELMHNYYINVKHDSPVKTPGDNILSDRKINKDISFRWNEFKEVIPMIGALI